MNAVEVLEWLHSVGADLTAVGDRLKVSAAPGALTLEVRETIARNKQELLLLLRDPAALAALHDPPLVPAPRGDKLPLSLFQQRLWIAEHIKDEGEATFNLVTLWCMPGRDAALLQRAIRDVVRRHEILRSTFQNQAGAAFVRIAPSEAVQIELRDLQALPLEEQARIPEAEALAAVTQPFNLATDPPVRWLTYITAGGQLITRVCAHHIAMDEWSLTLLRRELDSSLAACAAGAPAAPPALQYADFAAWERARQASPAVVSTLAWWERRLANLPGLCALPPDRRDGAPVSGAYGFAWDKTFTDELRVLAQQSRATLYMVLLAVCATVLRRHTGDGDIVLGSSLGVRERPELESMLGPFVGSVVLRLDLTDDPTFATLIDRARETVLDAHEHRQVSFEQLVERLKPVRSFEHAPLHQVTVQMHNASEAQRSRIYSGGTDQHLTWYAREAAGGLEMSLEYRADLYDRTTIERVANHLTTVLKEAVADSSRTVGTISLLTPAERLQVTRDFHGPAVALDPAPVTVRFERQTARTPHAPALRLGGTAMSYDALNRRANQIARHLRGAGAAPGVLVGICMERCADLLATLLAVLKTGAAYVPLDPDFPAARLDFMAEHSGLELLVLNTGAPGNVQPGDKWPPAVHAGRAFAARIIDLGADAETLDACDDGDLGITPAGADPAYVIYTSGSTGRPNGVVVSHAALSNFLGAMLGEPGLSGADILAAVTTVSFDIAGLELYLPLLAGACVVIVPREVASDGVALAGLLEEERVTVMQATPATWRLLIEARWAGGATFTALCGGEPLPEDLARSLRKRVGALWNMYGPTETTIWSTCGRFEPAEGQITIGRPIANTSIFIVDESGQPTPVGVPGELWIGGAGLASGYWRNPALTEAKFRPDPFHANDPSGSAPAREPAQRIYRTGDLVRWLPDGRIVHMGRLDRQVKLRGFRIEPGEIETALTAHDAVREAIVVCQGDSPDRQRLVAYVVYHPGRDLTTSEVRAHVRLSLPGYMIPSAFVSLDSVPRLPNGKVDRRALPDPFRQGSMASSVYVQPAPGAEEVIARIWADILKVDRVGADDNFFDLGGHSLLSLRAAAAVREQTGWPMPARAMFFKTLSQIAASLQSHEAEMRGAK